MSVSLSEKLRIPFTRIAAMLLCASIILSSSRWEHISILSDILFLTGCVLAGVASLGRLWCSLYIAGYKNTSLVTEGPYSITRNPLYFFSLIGAVGVGLATETLFIPLAIIILFSIYYPSVIKSEEVRLSDTHGKAFDVYSKKTPAFFPKLSLLKEPNTYIVNPKIFKKNLMGALWFVWFIGILELVEAFHEANIIPVVLEIY